MLVRSTASKLMPQSGYREVSQHDSWHTHSNDHPIQRWKKSITIDSPNRFTAKSSTKIDGLVPMGTTGESPTLNHEDHQRVIEHVVQTVVATKAAIKPIIVAGTGSNSTAEALETHPTCQASWR